jgi:ABC-type branched-subunit amino acid transport system ATPase component
MVPGELLALMGPSGSGKTSLLSIIAGRAAKAVETKGRVTTGGQRLTKADKRRIGFVLQDDLLYEVGGGAWREGRGVAGEVQKVRCSEVTRLPLRAPLLLVLPAMIAVVCPPSGPAAVGGGGV